MERALEKVARLMLLYPGTHWTGAEMSRRTGFSRAMISRVFGSLRNEGVIAQPYKNRFVLMEPIRLIMLWSCERRLPTPIHVQTSLNEQKVFNVLARRSGVALTLFSAAWLRTHYMKTRTIEVYVEGNRQASFVKALGRTSENPGLIAVYPAADDELLGADRVNGIPVVSVPQAFVDLMSFGGSGPRVALQLGRATGLLGE